MFFTSEHMTKLSAQAEQELTKQFSHVDFMDEFHNTDWFNEAYYKRHILECVLRINLNNELDSRALAKASLTNTACAKQLAFYIYDELGHDEMFAQDLYKYGYSQEDIDTARVFPSTMKLMGYLNFTVEKEGPLVSVLWDWFLEYYGDNYNGFITQKAAAILGQEKVDGAAAHVAFDEEEDHHGMMQDMLSSVIKSEHDLKLAEEYLSTLVGLVGEYFQELQANTL